MTTSINAEATAAGDVLRTFERGLSDARGQWDDEVRRNFDRACIADLSNLARRVTQELSELAGTVAAALAELDSIS